MIPLQNVRIIDKIATFFLGAINNLPYVIGVAGAKRIIANYEDRENDIGLVLWANTVSGLFARFINTWLSTCDVPYVLRFGINCFFMLFGLISCAFSKNFWLTLFCIFCIGFSANFGESVLLCFFTVIHKQVLLKSWSSGTGMAGILGASYCLVIDLTEVSYFWSFIGISPIVIIYIICFIIVRKGPSVDGNNSISAPNPQPLLQSSNQSETSNLSVEVNQSNESPLLEENVEHVTLCTCSILKPVWFFIFNCFAVYFLEYVIQTGYADIALPTEESKMYYYSLFNLCYQCGVFLSRSSLSLFAFPWVGWLTLAQLFMFLLLFVQVKFYYFMPFGVLIPIFFIVVLFGGCSYVNVFNLIMNSEKLTKKEKEMATSWNAFFISVGMIVAAIYTYIAQHTFLKK